MIPVDENISQSINIVQQLLASSFSEKDSAPIVEAQSFMPGFESEFDTSGSSRVEILFDTVTTEETSNTLEIHGLIENDLEERVPLVFFCETEWLNGERPMNREENDEEENDQEQKSFVLDFDKNTPLFSSSSFAVIFKNANDGSTSGKGRGYLRFEKRES